MDSLLSEAFMSESISVSGMNRQRLPDDWCRCRDDACPDHARCLRWVQRDAGGARLVVAASCYPGDRAARVEPCPALIEADVADDRV
jgi:hypothetical protein